MGIAGAMPIGVARKLLDLLGEAEASGAGVPECGQCCLQVTIVKWAFTSKGTAGILCDTSRSSQ